MLVAQHAQRARQAVVGAGMIERHDRQHAIGNLADAKSRQWAATAHGAHEEGASRRDRRVVELRRHHLFHEVAQGRRPQRVSHRGGGRVAVGAGAFDMLDRGNLLSSLDGQAEGSREQQAVAAAEDGQQVIVLNPTTPIGPNDTKPTPTGRIFVDFLNRKFPAYMDTGLNLVDVAEVARTHVCALTRGKPGRRYILGGENLTLKQILDKLAAVTGLPSPKVKVPYIMALATGVVDEVLTGHILHREPRATIDAVRMGKKKMFVSSAKAERELGWQTVPVDSALVRAVDWFRTNGYA